MNNVKIIFTDEELGIINQILEYRSKIAKYPMTIDYVLSGWEKLVDLICEGYNKFTVDEYPNDLFTREIIHEMTSAGIDNAEFTQWQLYLDNCFKNNTYLVDKPLMNLTDQQQNWWWYRIPKSINTQFRNVLTCYGFRIIME
jgi:hypothetical protein